MRRVVFLLVLLALAASDTVEGRTARSVCRASCDGLLQNCDGKHAYGPGAGLFFLRKFARRSCKRKWIRACQIRGVAVCSVPQVAGQWTFNGRLSTNPCDIDAPDEGSSTITLSQVGGLLIGTVGVIPVEGGLGGYSPISPASLNPTQGWEVHSADDCNGCCVHTMLSVFPEFFSAATLGVYGNCYEPPVLHCPVEYRGRMTR